MNNNYNSKTHPAQNPLRKSAGCVQINRLSFNHEKLLVPLYQIGDINDILITDHRA